MADVPQPPRRALDALMFRLPANDVGPPDFRVVRVDLIQFWQARGWFLLGDERVIRQADVEDVRKSDERSPWWRM